jgi:prepilin-type N-terminal cleavage/methylation domain-containing protein
MIEDRGQRAFTLIEMLVTLAAAAILMSGVLVIVTASAKDRLRMRELEDRDSLSQERLLEMLRMDLVNARSLEPLPEGKGIVVSGFGAMDPATLTREDRAVQVTYTVRGDGGRTTLVREQRYLDEQVPTKPWREIVAAGISWFSVEPTRPLPASNMQQNGPDKRLARECRVEMRFTNATRPTVMRNLVLH